MVVAGGGDDIPFLKTAYKSTSNFSFGATYRPYHSNFDTFTQMNTTGDPGWKYHVTTAKIWSLMIVRLSEIPVMQINAADYAVLLKNYIERLKHSIPSSVSFDWDELLATMKHDKELSHTCGKQAKGPRIAGPNLSLSGRTSTRGQQQRTVHNLNLLVNGDIPSVVWRLVVE